MSEEDPAEGMTVAAAAATGDELKLLYALRNRLSEAIEDCPMRDLSPLTRRLQDVVKEIRELEERRAKEGGESSGFSPGGDWDPSADI